MKELEPWIRIRFNLYQIDLDLGQIMYGLVEKIYTGLYKGIYICNAIICVNLLQSRPGCGNNCFSNILTQREPC